jgi:mutator protein MutT
MRENLLTALAGLSSIMSMHLHTNLIHHHSHLEKGKVKFCYRCGGSVVERFVSEEEKHRHTCDQCGLIIYLDPKVAVGTILQKDGKILLLKRNIEPARGKWTFPGGYMDRGEVVTQAAIRETKEEVSLDVRVSSLLNIYSYPGVEVVVIVYLAEILGGELRPGAEVQEVRFFSTDEIPWEELAFQSTSDALKELLKGLF